MVMTIESSKQVNPSLREAVRFPSWGKGEQHGENENKNEDETDDTDFLGLRTLDGIGLGSPSRLEI
jgi:hypothetical protein